MGVGFIVGVFWGYVLPSLFFIRFIIIFSNSNTSNVKPILVTSIM